MKKLTAEWVRKAEADIQAAKALRKARSKLHDGTCFHCQQAVEKYLKALLQELGADVPRIHDLEQLLDLLLPHDPTLRSRGLRVALSKMTEYAVEYRYPGVTATARNARSAFRIALKVRQAIRQRLHLSPRR